MSIISPGSGHLLPFYLSGPLPCPYLPGKIERKLFTRLTGDPSIDANINATLTRAGFRRSHDIVYRPACSECNACVPVRIPVNSFSASQSLKRIARRNNDLHVEAGEAAATEELYALFQTYQQARHPDSDMARMSFEDFHQMLTEGTANTSIYACRTREGALAGAVIAEHVEDGVSAVYSFFAPDEPRRSLGAFMILSLIEAMREKGLPYVYLGYWIAGSRKMSYKARFAPLQALGPQGWERMDPKG